MKYVYLLLAFCISFSISAQNNSFDEIISEHAVIRCEDVQYNAYTIIQGLYERKQIDSLYQFIDYWEDKCGFPEMSFRFKRLLDIETGRFNEDRISADWIEFLIAYKSLTTNGIPQKARDLGEVDVNQQLEYLNTFLYNYARSIPLPAYSLDAQLMLAFYSSKNPTFAKIAEALPEESRLSEFYHHESKRVEETAVWNIQFNAGYYRPYGRLERFGGHPVLGMGYSYGIRSHLIGLQLDFQAGPSRDEYTVSYNGALISQRKWTGMYVGLEYYYEFIKQEKFSFAVSPGIGYDRITALPSENQYGEESKGLRSLNANLGFQGRYRYGEEHSVGLQLRVNRADFDNPGGTTLNGLYATIKVFWTFTDDLRTSHRRKLLK